MKYTQLLITSVPNSPATIKHSWTNGGKIIDASHTNFYLLNSGVTEPNIAKFLHHVEKWLPVNLLKSKLRHFNNFRIGSVPNVKLRPSRGKDSTIPCVNSEVTGPMFTTFVPHVELLLPLLMRALTRRYCIPFRNAMAKSEGSQFRRLQKAPKFISSHRNVPWATRNFMSN